MNTLYVLSWGENSDDYPNQMRHQRFYSSRRLALMAMDKLIKANVNTPEEYAIAEDLSLNPLIRISEWDMDNLKF